MRQAASEEGRREHHELAATQGPAHGEALARRPGRRGGGWSHRRPSFSCARIQSRRSASSFSMSFLRPSRLTRRSNRGGRRGRRHLTVGPRNFIVPPQRLLVAYVQRCGLEGNQMNTLLAAGCAVACLALSHPASAALITFDAILTGTQETPPNASPATGTGSVVADTVAQTLGVSESFAMLSSPSTISHLHFAPP